MSQNVVDSETTMVRVGDLEIAVVRLCVLTNNPNAYSQAKEVVGLLLGNGLVEGSIISPIGLVFTFRTEKWVYGSRFEFTRKRDGLRVECNKKLFVTVYGCFGDQKNERLSKDEVEKLHKEMEGRSLQNLDCIVVNRLVQQTFMQYIAEKVLAFATNY